MVKHIFRIALLLLMPLFGIGNAYAKGAPAMLKIRGPGISDVLEITNVGLLISFGWGEFADFDAPIAARDNFDGGYIITRYVLMGGTTMRSLDTLTYFPGSGDEDSIVYYNGIIDKKFILGGTPQDGKWFRVSAQGEAAIQRIFDTYNISTTKNSPLNFFIPTSIRSWIIYGIILVLVSVAIFLVIKLKNSNKGT
jgi:hypothetical protein